MRFLLEARSDTDLWGRAFGELLRPGDVVALIGDLGAGKTTLTQSIAAGMGVCDPVTSPTYTLIQEYSGKIPLYHFDPYRLTRPEEVADLGLYDYLERDGVVIIEWADRITNLLPPDRFEITLTIPESSGTNVDEEGDSSRNLTIVGLGERPSGVVNALGELQSLSSLKPQVKAQN